MIDGPPNWSDTRKDLPHLSRQVTHRGSVRFTATYEDRRGSKRVALDMKRLDVRALQTEAEVFDLLTATAVGGANNN